MIYLFVVVLFLQTLFWWVFQFPIIGFDWIYQLKFFNFIAVAVLIWIISGKAQ
tara:strand:+ start:604 stop:762 length:159 start_codon:yes stop_codon:yes gene_type:complete